MGFVWNFFINVRKASDKWMILLFPVITLVLFLIAIVGLWLFNFLK
ncbi:MAG: hypothetical protein K2X01_06050 [Cyanobacteria bacterium]|nr:hypothetical protein [Cyanobacteriota bacterium]